MLPHFPELTHGQHYFCTTYEGTLLSIVTKDKTPERSSQSTIIYETLPRCQALCRELDPEKFLPFTEGWDFSPNGPVLVWSHYPFIHSFTHSYIWQDQDQPPGANREENLQVKILQTRKKRNGAEGKLEWAHNSTWLCVWLRGLLIQTKALGFCVGLKNK